MNKITFYTSLAATPLIALYFLVTSHGQTGPYSGSPGDNNTSCTVCHNGGSFDGQVVLTGIPENYEPGKTYSLNLKIEGGESVRRGFNIVAENGSDAKVGQWETSEDTQLRYDDGGLTHVSDSNTNTSWTMNWTAPENDEGPITFYYATVQGNGSGFSGDTVITGSSDSVLNTESEDWSKVRIFPNPVSSALHVDLAAFQEASFSIFDLNGRLMKNGNVNSVQSIAMGEFPSGVYLLHLNSGEHSLIEKIIKN